MHQLKEITSLYDKAKSAIGKWRVQAIIQAESSGEFRRENPSCSSSPLGNM